MKNLAALSLITIGLVSLATIPANAAPWCSQYCSCSSNCWTQCYDEGGANACINYICSDFCDTSAPSKETDAFALVENQEALCEYFPADLPQASTERAAPVLTLDEYGINVKR